MSYNPNNQNGSALSSGSAPVVIAYDQAAVQIAPGYVLSQPTNQSLAATGSVQWMVQTGGFYYLTITNAPAATTTFVATVIFETSPDNSFWSTVNANPLTGLPGTGLAATNTTSAPGLWRVQIPGNNNYIRARVSSRTSGTVWAYLEPAGTPNTTIQIPFTPSVTVANTIVGWIDTTGMSEIAVQVSAVTTTIVTAQGTNDPTGTYVQSVQVINDNMTNQGVLNNIVSPMTASIVNPSEKWVRFQVTGTGTVFTVQGVTARFGQSIRMNAGQSSVGIQGTPTVNVGTATTVTTVAVVTKGNIGQPIQATDATSAAVTTTTTTAPFTPGYGTAYQINLQVTAVSGTTPTMDVEVQESRDSGTNYIPIYDFPRITATGSYNSPVMFMTGTVIRYVQTIGGTTPSFTRGIYRMQNSSTASIIRQLIDRTIVLTTLSSATPVVYAEQNTKNVQLTVNIGTATAAPALQLQASDDSGVTWYLIGSAITAIASATVSVTINNITAQQFRAIVTTAGTTVAAGYVLIRVF